MRKHGAQMRILFFGLGFTGPQSPGPGPLGGQTWPTSTGAPIGPSHSRPFTDAPLHYRLELACDALLTHGGHETTLVGQLSSDPANGRLVGTSWTGEQIDNAELVVLQGLVSAEAVTAARKAGQAVICDVTDTPEVPTTYLYYDLVELMRPAAMAMYRASDAITVSSQYLAAYLRNLPGFPPVHLLRNALNIAEWQPPPRTQASRPTRRPTIGWCGTLLERADDTSVLRPWLGRFLEEHDLTFVHVGDGAMGVPGKTYQPPSFAEAAGIDPERVVRRPVRSFSDYLATRPWEEIDIQLVPLMDHHYSRGKSCLKGLEAAAQQIAFVASPQAEYQWLGCGWLAGSSIEDQPPAAWIAALESALDPTERQRAIRHANERIASQDIGMRWAEWAAVYESVLDRR